MALGVEVPGLRNFPASSGPGFSIPSNQHALWCWVRGADRGHLQRRGEALEDQLAESFALADMLDTFVHDGGRDLTGYEDGTENPSDDDAIAAAVIGGSQSSFVAVQQWVHDLARFRQWPEDDRDAIIGRRHADNEELDDAPPSAHVKRSEQEFFDPPAFMVRRSMAYADVDGEGLLFKAFCADLRQFEVILDRMTGATDKIVDALFRFTRPITGSYYWCPPTSEGRLDLTALLG